MNTRDSFSVLYLKLMLLMSLAACKHKKSKNKEIEAEGSKKKNILIKDFVKSFKYILYVQCMGFGRRVCLCVCLNVKGGNKKKKI